MAKTRQTSKGTGKTRQGARAPGKTSRGSMSVAEPRTTAQQPLRPHHGVATLVLGILGIACCFICGIIAWVMGSSDLEEMDAGIMDPSGRGLTKAGKVCGMVGVIIAAIVLAFALLSAVMSLLAGSCIL
jgi:hypothetical protein